MITTENGKKYISDLDGHELEVDMDLEVGHCFIAIYLDGPLEGEEVFLPKEYVNGTEEVDKVTYY